MMPLRKMLLSTGLILALGLILAMMTACARGEWTSSETPLYTAYNIWFEKPNNISCVNYRRGTLIPAGTPVTAIRMRGSKKIDFTTANGTYTIQYHPQFHPGMSLADFKNRAFTPRSLNQLTEGMTPDEKQCVSQGLLRPGVRRVCVLAAYGYPPEHQTPSVQSNTWTYWENRFKRNQVVFDADGYVAKF